MAWYFYYQINGGEEEWRPDLAESRNAIVGAHKPRYTTVLDIDTLITKETEREAIMQAHYRGPFISTSMFRKRTAARQLQ